MRRRINIDLTAWPEGSERMMLDAVTTPTGGETDQFRDGEERVVVRPFEGE